MIISKKKDVEDFLKVLKETLNSSSFQIQKHFFMNLKNDSSYYSNMGTLIDLEFSMKDVIRVIKSLQLEDYCETLFDRQDEYPPLLYVFGKEISGKTIYIKLKIREIEERIICISFHYARMPMKYIYR